MQVDFRTEPARYKHWRLTLRRAAWPRWRWTCDEDGGLRPGYELKLNSYDLGVDIELYDAIQRLRFEHPEVRRGGPHLGQGARVLRGRQHPHAGPVLARLEGELLQVHQRDAQRDRGGHGGVAARCGSRAVNGPCAGGGYELALAYRADRDGRRRQHHPWRCPRCRCSPCCPGTGGLTRLVDKRQVRRDRADFFCTLEEGIKGQRAVEWRLVDEVVPRSRLDEARAAARRRAGRAQRPAGRRARHRARRRSSARIEGDRIAYRCVTCAIDRAPRRGRDHGGRARDAAPPADLAGIHAAGADFWPLAVARELDDLILHLRANEEEIGLWVLRTTGARRPGGGARPAARAARGATGSCARSGSISSAR